MRRPFFLAACDIPRFDWSPMKTIFKQGKLLFALAVAAVGMENLICAHVALPVFAGSRDAIPVLPFVPAIPALAYLVGFVLLAAGLSTALNRGARLEALLLAFFFLACLLVLLLPKAIASPLDLNIRTCVFEELSFAAAALTLAGSLRTHAENKWIDPLAAAGPYLFAISAVVFGITHFLVAPYIASLIPAWIPAPLFSAYLTGAAFIAVGVSFATGILARWAAFSLGLMFLLWFLLLHLPRVVAHSRTPAEWSSAFIALGMCGASWICGMHFLPSGNRNSPSLGPS